MKNDQPKRSDTSFYTAIALLGQIGFFIALPLVGGTILGRFIDMSLHTSTPLATILGLLLGLAVGVALVVRAVSQLEKK